MNQITSRKFLIILTIALVLLTQTAESSSIFGDGGLFGKGKQSSLTGDSCGGMSIFGNGGTGNCSAARSVKVDGIMGWILPGLSLLFL